MLMTKHAWLSSYLIPFCLKNFFTSSNDTDPKLRESKELKWRLGCAHIGYGHYSNSILLPDTKEFIKKSVQNEL